MKQLEQYSNNHYFSSMSSKRKSLPSKIESSPTNPLTETYLRNLQKCSNQFPIGRPGIHLPRQPFNQDQVRKFTLKFRISFE